MQFLAAFFLLFRVALFAATPILAFMNGIEMAIFSFLTASLCGFAVEFFKGTMFDKPSHRGIYKTR